jgi:hypothetical protein
MGFHRTDSVRARVERVLSDANLPANVRGYGEKLLRRFGEPVRVAILGLPGSGKTQLLNMLLGRCLLPAGSQLPAMEIVAGASWRTRIARGDATTCTFEHVVLEGPELAEAKMITLEAPLGILDSISLYEAGAEASIESQRQALEFGAKRAEILVWCTQEFTEIERRRWRLVPDALKDHAFLAVTKADELQRDGVLSQRLASMNAALAEEFCGVFPVATLRALAALDGERSDQAAFAASGGRALRNAVLKHVEQGRRADLDNALLFLRRYETARSGADIRGTSARGRSDGVTPAASAGSSDRRALLEQALGHLLDRSEVLAELVPQAGKDKHARFLAACAEAAEELSELFAAHAIGAATVSIHESVSEASEMMLLLQLEKGVGPAADAALLLLQVRRELEDELAG